jgi:hypothetical protein
VKIQAFEVQGIVDWPVGSRVGVIPAIVITGAKDATEARANYAGAVKAAGHRKWLVFKVRTLPALTAQAAELVDSALETARAVG